MLEAPLPLLTPRPPGNARLPRNSLQVCRQCIVDTDKPISGRGLTEGVSQIYIYQVEPCRRRQWLIQTHVVVFFFFFFFGGGGGGEWEERQQNKPLYQLKISYLHESRTFFFFEGGGGVVVITPFAPPPLDPPLPRVRAGGLSIGWSICTQTLYSLPPLSSRLLCVQEADPGGGQTGHMSVGDIQPPTTWRSDCETLSSSTW